MDKFDKILQRSNESREFDELQVYVENTDVDELSEILKAKLTAPNFLTIWKNVFQGFTDTSDSHLKRFSIVKTVLKELEYKSTNTSQCNLIIHQLSMELIKFKSEHLIELCNFCTDSIQANKTSQMCWKELLPELMNIIIEKDSFEFNGTEITGIEFKKQLINSLCMMPWSPNIATSVASMFIDMPLTKEEHVQVVNKLCLFIEKLTPQEVPALVYQLLKLTSDSSCRSVFLKLQKYFGSTVYEHVQSESPDSTDLDAIETTSNLEAIDAESTVLFHIHSAASLGHECIKNYLLSLKNLLRAPEFVLHPFHLSVLFTISTIPHYEEKIFEIIRSSVAKTYSEEQKVLSSAWFRDMIANTCGVEELFSQIINLSVQNRELVFQGLVNFAFVLLSVGAQLGRDPIAEKQWQLGNLILYKVIKRKRHIAPVIIQTLSNYIISGSNVTQYIECLYMLTKNLPLLMLENKNIILQLMESLVQMPGSNANQLLDALISLTKVSHTIRDHLILLLRKGLFSRTIETKQMAVNGFLKLLVNLKISDLPCLSQSSYSGSFYSGHSLFTQISVSRISTQSGPSVFSNEALCMEILSILRRCFSQQIQVKNELYDGLYSTFCRNPDLCIAILEVLDGHFNQFYEMDESALPPLKFGKVTVEKDISVMLQEPLGKLTFTISLILSKAVTLDQENVTVMKYMNIMESLCKRMAKCELAHLELDDGTDLFDVLPECQQKLYIIKEAMNVYEALIGYKFFTWDSEIENYGQEVNNLFQGLSRLKHFVKNLSKPNKKSDLKKKKLETSTQQTKSQATTSNIKKADMEKILKPIKLCDTTLDFLVIIKMLRLLYEPTVSWATIPQVSVLKTKTEFHQYVLNATVQKLTSLKHKKFINVEDSKLMYGHLCEIGSILYQGVIERMVEFIDFDCTSGALVAECFLLILNLISHQYKANFKSFICRATGNLEDRDLVLCLTEIFVSYQKVVEVDEDEAPAEDGELKKLSLHAIHTLHFIINYIPLDPDALPLQVQVLDWLKRFAMKNTIKNRQIATSFVNLLFDANIKFKVSLTLFENIAIRIGDITGVINEEDNTDVERFTIITELTVQNIILSLCNFIKSILEEVDWIIARLRAEYNMIMYPGEDNIERKKEFLKSKEKGVCCQLCYVVTLLINLSNCTVPAGNLSEAIFKNLQLLYCTLSSLTKHFNVRSSKVNPVFQAARFERLVKLAGKQLAPILYKFIMYIEENQKQECTAATQEKKKSVDTSVLKKKILKETRVIPKVVYEVEQFSKTVIQLSVKTKIDLSKFVGQGTVRDFRIMHLKEVLEKADPPLITQNNDTTMESIQEENSGNETSESELPPSKKSRV